MSNIETIIVLMLLVIAVPDICRKVGRPALVFPAFVLFGFIINPLLNEDVQTMLEQAGEIGFLLLLFEVGLEIELPKFQVFLKPLKFALNWFFIQFPVGLVVSRFAGLGWMQSLIASTALSACSVGMAYPAWKNFSGMTEETKNFTLSVMVALEMFAILLLALATTVLGHGLGWMLLVKLAGISIAVYLISRFARHVQRLFQLILSRTTHWRVHWLVLLVLAICAVGSRLGLDAPKTAFVLGLMLSSTKHNGVSLEQHMAPISHRFLIPVFFVSLGLLIKWKLFFSPVALLGVGSALLLLGMREILHRRWLKTGGNGRAYLLLCPNLTIVALGAKAMQRHGVDQGALAWLILTGLFMTLYSLILLPAAKDAASTAAITPVSEAILEAKSNTP